MSMSHSSGDVQKAMEHKSVVQESHIDMSCNFGICYYCKLIDADELDFNSGVVGSGTEVYED